MIDTTLIECARWSTKNTNMASEASTRTRATVTDSPGTWSTSAPGSMWRNVNNA